MAVSAGLGAAWGTLLKYIHVGDAGAVSIYYTEISFESQFKDGEDNPIIIASKPHDILLQMVEFQMLIM